MDAVALGLGREVISENGRLADRLQAWPLAGRVSLTQHDIRELQLAKSAVASGLLILCAEFGITPRELERVFVAGAFGNYVNPESARRIGLLPMSAERTVPSGNAALHGAKLSLFANAEPQVRNILGVTEHVSLNEHARFQEIFVEQLRFSS